MPGGTDLQGNQQEETQGGGGRSPADATPGALHRRVIGHEPGRDPNQGDGEKGQEGVLQDRSGKIQCQAKLVGLGGRSRPRREIP